MLQQAFGPLNLTPDQFWDLSWPEFWLLYDGWEYRQELQMHHTRILGTTMVNTSINAPKRPMQVTSFIELKRIDQRAVVKFSDSDVQRMLKTFSNRDGKKYILADVTNE